MVKHVYGRATTFRFSKHEISGSHIISNFLTFNEIKCDDAAWQWTHSTLIQGLISVVDVVFNQWCGFILGVFEKECEDPQ